MEPHRKKIRLEAQRYVGQTSYFITFCCAHRRPVFSDPANSEWFIERLRQQSDAYGFAVYAYCVMPDHFHALVSGRHLNSDLMAFLKNLKQTTSYYYRQRCRANLWQRRFYDHILRRGERADAVAEYIWMNPVRAGLCSDPRDYLHSGSFTVDWTKMVRPIESWLPEWKRK